jgi:hypothetical protein
MAVRRKLSLSATSAISTAGRLLGAAWVCCSTAQKVCAQIMTASATAIVFITEFVPKEKAAIDWSAPILFYSGV